MVDAADSKSAVGDHVGVRVPPPAPFFFVAPQIAKFASSVFFSSRQGRPRRPALMYFKMIFFQISIPVAQICNPNKKKGNLREKFWPEWGVIAEKIFPSCYHADRNHLQRRILFYRRELDCYWSIAPPLNEKCGYDKH